MEISSELKTAVVTLAGLIKGDPRYAAVTEAEAAYTGNGEINRLLTEYNVQQAALTETFKDGEGDPQLTEAIRRRLNELYHQVVEHPAYLRYKEASDAYNEFYQAVSAELDFALTGKRSDCTHDCSTCSGCH